MSWEWLGDIAAEAVSNYVVKQARDLVTEDSSNPEYDRALVELTMRLTGAPEENRGLIEDELGVRSTLHRSTPVNFGHAIACSCGWQSSGVGRKVDQVVEYQYHVGARHDGPDTVVTR